MMAQKQEIQQKLAERDIDESLKPIKKIKSSKKKTLIDDIDENLEDESIINDDFETENEVKLDSSYRDYGGGGKKAENKKRENLLSTAMQMQKTREIEDKSLNLDSIYHLFKLNPKLEELHLCTYQEFI